MVNLCFQNSSLGGGNSNMFYFQSYLGKIPILTHIFSDGLVQPPTSSSLIPWCFGMNFIARKHGVFRWYRSRYGGGPWFQGHENSLAIWRIWCHYWYQMQPEMWCFSRFGFIYFKVSKYIVGWELFFLFDQSFDNLWFDMRFWFIGHLASGRTP